MICKRYNEDFRGSLTSQQRLRFSKLRSTVSILKLGYSLYIFIRIEIKSRIAAALSSSINKQAIMSFLTTTLLLAQYSGKEEGRRRGSGVIVTVAIFVPCQLFGVVVVETAFVTFDGAGLDLANSVTL